MRPLHPHDPPSVGPYRLRAVLGQDADARHYLGLAPDGAAVTVTVARPERATDTAFRDGFASRVSAAHRLHSPAVCRVLSADLTGTVPWAAAARPPGPTLAELLERHRPLAPNALRTLALVLAQALADLHRAGLAHGSPTPADVVVTADSALLTSPASTATGATPAQDVHTWAATVAHACGARPDDTRAVPLPFRALVDTCLSGDPALRPSSDDLVRMLGGPRTPDPWPPEVLAVVAAAPAELRPPEGPRSEDVGRSGDVRAEDTRRSGVIRAEDTRRSGDVRSGDVRPGGLGSDEDTTVSLDTGGDAGGGRGRAQWGTRRLLLLGAGGLALALVAATAAALGQAGPVGPGADGAAGSSAVDGPSDAPSSDVLADADCADSEGFAPTAPPPSRESGTPSRVVFSPDGNAVAVSGPEAITVWDWRGGRRIARLPWWGGVTGNVDFAPRGCVVASVAETTRADEGHPDQVAATYDLASGTMTEHLGPQEPATEVLDPDVSGVDGLAFSPSGALLAVRLGTSEIGVVDLATGETVSTLDSVGGGSTDLTFLDEDRVAAIDGEALRAWDIATGERVHTVRPVSGYEFTAVPGTDEVVFVRGGAVVRWNLADNAEVSAFPLTDDARNLTALPVDIIVDDAHGRIHVSWMDADDTTVVHVGRFFDAETGELLNDPDETPFTGSVALHPEGEVIAAIVDGGGVDLVDPHTFEVTGPLF